MKTECTGCPVFTLCLGAVEEFSVRAFRCARCGQLIAYNTRIAAEPKCLSVKDKILKTGMWCNLCYGKSGSPYDKQR